MGERGCFSCSLSSFTHIVLLRIHPRNAHLDARQHPPAVRILWNFTNAGYGFIVLCSVNSMSHSCSSVLADFTTIDGVPPREMELYALWPRFWGLHLRLMHRTRTHFLFRPSTLFPHGYGADTSPFESYLRPESMLGIVEFVVHDGVMVVFGLLELFSLDEEEREKERKNVQETANAWFARV